MAASGIDRAVVEQIVREVVLSKLGSNGDPRPKLAVHASARHMHLCDRGLDRVR